MILADKIITLRKKNGWSQEELAGRVGVSRQSVSKWEGAQSVPDLEKVLLLSEAFGVSTDYLLKDDMEEAEYVEAPDVESVRRVTMEDANAYLAVKRDTSWRIALASYICILSPITLFLLGAASEKTEFAITEGFAVGVGLTVLLLMVASAVAMFLFCGAKTAPYEYLDKEPIETEYGVTGMVRERQKLYRERYTRSNVLGVCLCILSAIPLFVGPFLSPDDLFMVAMLSLLLIVAGAGVYILVRTGIVWASMEKLLQEGEYTVSSKRENAVNGPVATIFWLLTTAVYLGYSFITEDWQNSWIVWPVAGVLFAAVMAVCSLVTRNKN